MIGKLILAHCLADDEVVFVTSITRKSLGIVHSKLREVIHNDFQDYSGIEQQMKNHHICFYCIGVYTGQVPDKEFKKITVDFTKAFADALKRNSDHITFCFLSGAGADTSEKSSLIFAREKGIAENYLLKVGFEKTFIFRPGYIYPVTRRLEPNFAYKIMRFLYKPVSVIYPNIGITSTNLAFKMFKIGMNGGNKNIYENKDLTH